jgi:hypothetical protein
MTDLVGDGWWNDLDISGDISKQEMIQEAQAWLDDQGYSVHVLNCKVNDDDTEWYIEGNFHNPGFAKKGVAEDSIEEGFGSKLAGLGLAGAMALGSAGANARVSGDQDPNINRLTGKPNTTQVSPADTSALSANKLRGSDLTKADSVDRSQNIVTVDGKEYEMIMIEPGGIRPRGGQRIAIPMAMMGFRGIGNFIGILAGNKVYVLPINEETNESRKNEHKQVPVSEDVENIMSALIENLIRK